MEVLIDRDDASFYTDEGTRELQALSSASDLKAAGFPQLQRLRDAGRLDSPPRWLVWGTYDCAAEWDVYQHLFPVFGRSVLQIGGRGIHACLLALAGAEASLLTPVPAEGDYARALAKLAGVSLRVSIGVAEEIPLPSNSFDRVVVEGCAHHFDMPRALPEIHRILQLGGRFAAAEPWRAPGYSLGIKVFGKREPVNCTPLTRERIYPAANCFSQFHIVHHGTFTRYAAITAGKVLPLSIGMVWRLMRADDAVASLLGLRRFGSSVALLAQK